jgi:hypothetical protein
MRPAQFYLICVRFTAAFCISVAFLRRVLCRIKFGAAVTGVEREIVDFLISASHSHVWKMRVQRFRKYAFGVAALDAHAAFLLMINKIAALSSQHATLI